jgi:hypothetical protein
MKTRCTCALVAFAIVATGGDALAQSETEEPPSSVGGDEPAAKPYDPIDPEEGISDWDHFEFSMGFLGGQRHYDRTKFRWDSGGDAIDGARSLVEPFTKAPYDELFVAGLRYDIRLVVSYVRMTTGVDIPFALNKPADAIGTFDIGGVQRSVTVESISPVALRFGIGGELPVGPVAPFVDILGSVSWTNTTLRIDDAVVDYKSVGFTLSTRAGARFHVRRWFFATVAGEIGIVGDVRWGAELGVGFAVM